LTSYF